MRAIRDVAAAASGTQRPTQVQLDDAATRLADLVRWYHQAPETSWWREQDRLELATLLRQGTLDGRLERAEAWAHRGAPVAAATTPQGSGAAQGWAALLEAIGARGARAAHLVVPAGCDPARWRAACARVGPLEIAQARDQAPLREAWLAAYAAPLRVAG